MKPLVLTAAAVVERRMTALGFVYLFFTSYDGPGYPIPVAGRVVDRLVSHRASKD